MKISGARIQSFLRQPGTDTAAILLFGPDRGLVRERAQDVGKTAAPDLSDPFRVVQFSGQDLKADAARLIDEAAQFSMTGGRRLIWINEATDAVTSILKIFLKPANSKPWLSSRPASWGRAPPYENFSRSQKMQQPLVVTKTTARRFTLSSMNHWPGMG